MVFARPFCHTLRNCSSFSNYLTAEIRHFVNQRCIESIVNFLFAYDKSLGVRSDIKDGIFLVYNTFLSRDVCFVSVCLFNFIRKADNENGTSCSARHMYACVCAAGSLSTAGAPHKGARAGRGGRSLTIRDLSPGAREISTPISSSLFLE